MSNGGAEEDHLYTQTATLGARYPDLFERRVFITGGGSGIGAELVAAFAKQGAKVAFVDIDDQASELLVNALERDGHAPPWWRRIDVRDVSAMQASIREASAFVGDFDILVNNVASDDRHALQDVTIEYFDQRMAINQRPSFFAIQSVFEGMKRRGGGSIINLGSTGWQSKADGYPCYAIAKSSINGLTRGLARFLGSHRIRINTVSPGWVMTQRQKEKWLDEAGEREIERNQCLPDRIVPADIAGMVLFLASKEAAMCTAQEFTVDAGWT